MASWTGSPSTMSSWAFANAFFGTAGGIVFGRTVYQGFVDYWDRLDPEDPSVTPLEVEFAAIFRGLTRAVVSTTLQSVNDNAELIREGVPSAIAALKRRSADDLLLICGPRLRSTLVRHALVDQLRVLMVPVVLGGGVPHMSDLDQPLRLRLAGTRTFSGGVVMLDYEPEPASMPFD